MEVKRFALSAAGAAAASGSGYALASMVTSTFDTDGIIVGFETIVIETGLSGTLTGMDITVNFYDSNPSGVWASDLLIAVDDGSNVAGIEWGGFNATLGYTQGGSFSWAPAYGNYSASFSGYSLPVNDGKLSVINGWKTSPGGAWSGSVTLYGLEIGGGGASTTSAAVVPEPASCVLVVTGLAMATVMKRFRSWRTKPSVATTAIQPLSDT